MQQCDQDPPYLTPSALVRWNPGCKAEVYARFSCHSVFKAIFSLWVAVPKVLCWNSQHRCAVNLGPPSVSADLPVLPPAGHWPVLLLGNQGSKQKKYPFFQREISQLCQMRSLLAIRFLEVTPDRVGMAYQINRGFFFFSLCIGGVRINPGRHWGFQERAAKSCGQKSQEQLTLFWSEI